MGHKGEYKVTREVHIINIITTTKWAGGETQTLTERGGVRGGGTHYMYIVL